MSQYEITRSCGHVETVNITGTDVHGERGRRAEWEATRTCRSCWTTSRDEQRAVTAAASTLTGSPKQVAWAEDIRSATAAKIADMQAQMDTGVAAHPDKAADAARVMAVVNHEFGSHTDARWWIDQRDSIDAFLAIRSAASTMLHAK